MAKTVDDYKLPEMSGRFLDKEIVGFDPVYGTPIFGDLPDEELPVDEQKPLFPEDGRSDGNFQLNSEELDAGFIRDASNNYGFANRDADAWGWAAKGAGRLFGPAGSFLINGLLSTDSKAVQAAYKDVFGRERPMATHFGNAISGGDVDGYVSSIEVDGKKYDITLAPDPEKPTDITPTQAKELLAKSGDKAKEVGEVADKRDSFIERGAQKARSILSDDPQKAPTVRTEEEIKRDAPVQASPLLEDDRPVIGDRLVEPSYNPPVEDRFKGPATIGSRGEQPSPSNYAPASMAPVGRSFIDYAGMPVLDMTDDIPYGRQATANKKDYEGAVIHHSEELTPAAIHAMTNSPRERGAYVGYHTAVTPDGTLVQLAPDDVRVNHIGQVPAPPTPLGATLDNTNSYAFSFLGADRSPTPEAIATATDFLEAKGFTAGQLTPHAKGRTIQTDEVEGQYATDMMNELMSIPDGPQGRFGPRSAIYGTPLPNRERTIMDDPIIADSVPPPAIERNIGAEANFTTAPRFPAEMAARNSITVTPEEREALALTLAGEIDSRLSPLDSDEGRRNAANILASIENRFGSQRAGSFGKNVDYTDRRDVVYQPKQFSTFNDDYGKRIAEGNFALAPDTFRGFVDDFYSGKLRPDDYSITHYVNPSIAKPSWTNVMDEKANVGGHSFLSNDIYGNIIGNRMSDVYGDLGANKNMSPADQYASYGQGQRNMFTEIAGIDNARPEMKDINIATAQSIMNTEPLGFRDEARTFNNDAFDSFVDSEPTQQTTEVSDNTQNTADSGPSGTGSEDDGSTYDGSSDTDVSTDTSVSESDTTEDDDSDTV